ncbi:hypothetical protein [Rhizobium mongolense]|uniref:Uncharacterized protein n=1 Tax=Rhizobium mongolense TaxID=57676 RepID=A0ABR6IYA2_9HYPH|nr:hypothetical protein [Rhizobium mongolense]MBB4232902.1 hypothetical protein [Rhizobium mongolense]
MHVTVSRDESGRLASASKPEALRIDKGIGRLGWAVQEVHLFGSPRWPATSKNAETFKKMAAAELHSTTAKVPWEAGEKL